MEELVKMPKEQDVEEAQIWQFLFACENCEAGCETEEGLKAKPESICSHRGGAQPCQLASHSIWQACGLTAPINKIN